MKKIGINYCSISAIADVLKSKPEYKLAIRLNCIYQVARGLSSREVASGLLFSHSQVCNLVKNFNSYGFDGLKDKVRQGKPSRINTEQLEELRDIILNKSPDEYGYNTGTWTAPIIVCLLKRLYNIDYSDDSVYYILKKKLKFSHKKGRGFYLEQDVNKRREFIDIKKKYRNQKRK